MRSTTQSRAVWRATLLTVLAAACGDAPETTAVPEAAEPSAPTETAPEPEVPDPPAAAPRGAGEESAPASIEEQLEQKVSFEFAGAAATDVIAMIGTMTGVEVVVDPDIAPELESVPVTLKLSDVSARVALQTLARVLGGKKVEVREDAVWLTNP